MAIGIDDLDDDDVLDYEQEQDQANQQVQEPDSYQSDEQDNDFISDFLKTKGIDDITKIKFEDDDNQIIERDWNDLTKQEKFNILNTHFDVPTYQSNNELTDEEIQLVNEIRSSNMTPSQYLSQFQNTEPQEPVYKVDDLSDDELYILDLESRVGSELSDEDASNALAIAKQNEDFYKKQVDGIRKEYKEREDFRVQQEEAALYEQQQEAFNNFQENIINAIDGFNSIGNLDLDFGDSDKEELAEFILSQDEQGNNYLYQALQDPELLTKAAWFILNGEDAFNSVSDYFTNQIKLVSDNQYKKGFEDGKKGVSSRPTVVIQQKNNPTQQKVYKSIDELDD